MMIVGKHKVKSHMTLEYTFSGIRILDGTLTPVDWRLSVDLVALDKKGKSHDDAEYHATLNYQKLFFWLDTNLQNIVVVDVNSNTDLYIANLSANIMMYCPAEPYDDLIAEMLHSKLTALAEESLLVGEVKLKGSDMAVQYTYDCTTDGYDLPVTTEEYYPDGVARDIEPWWMRNDGFTFEFIRPDKTDLSDEELFKDVVDPLTEFNKFIEDSADKVGGLVKEPAKIVQVDRWKPKKVV